MMINISGYVSTDLFVWVKELKLEFIVMQWS